jgi:two-component system OmpR family response regulator/two-component system response regulator QseB
MRLLLVEDDPHLGDGLMVGLRQQGYAVDWVKDGVAGELALASEPFDLVVLDLGLPRRSGLEVLRKLRAQGKATPVLILTARDATADKVAGLAAGADDYVVKPVDLDELAARVRALTRRAADRAQPVLRHGELELDPAVHRVTLAGQDTEGSGLGLSIATRIAELHGAHLELDEGIDGHGLCVRVQFAGHR